MFRTDVKAQVPWPNVNGMFWKWVELVAALPHFLVTVHQPETIEDPDFHTTLIFSDIKDVLAIVNEPKNTFEVVRIDLLSPEYLNGSNGFKLGQLSEIWMEKETGKKLYVFADGSRMEMKWPSSEDTPVNYEKVLTLPVDLTESTSKDHLH